MNDAEQLLSDLAFALIAVFPYCLSLSEVLAMILTLWIYEKQHIKPHKRAQFEFQQCVLRHLCVQFCG